MSCTIALFVQHPKCSVQSTNGVIKALGKDYNYKVFTKHETEDDFFDNVDLICFPGGVGDSDAYDTYFKSHGRLITDFIKRGGRYLGICMGAYWAGKDYFDILDGVNSLQYIKRPNTDTRRPHAKNIKINWQETNTTMFFYDGCAMVGDGDYETIATYANGDAMAIIQKNIGLIGCHPESQQFWYDSYSWLKGKYHNGTQHKLLLDFVNELMER
jgi:glutamine amidotransferase-like uncharacterized protein